MTCIIAYSNGKESFLAGDKIAVNTSTCEKYLETKPKIFKKVFKSIRDDIVKDEYLAIGGTTSFRMLQLLEYELILPQNERTDFETYLIRDCIPVIRRLFKEDWDAYGEGQDTAGGSFIILHNHKIYSVQPEFSVMHPSTSYYAIGCADSLAKGAIGALEVTSGVMNNIDTIFEIISNNCTNVSKEYDIIRFD